jgi:hypothetical protein
MGIVSKIAAATIGGHKRWVLSDGTDDVVFDVTEEYSTMKPGELAKHPVEAGSDLTDHHDKKPQEIRMSVLLTDEGLLSLRTLFKTGVEERAAILDNWYESATVLELGGKNIIESVMIETIGNPVSSELGDSRRFTMTLKKVTIADTTTPGNAGLRDQETEEVG